MKKQFHISDVLSITTGRLVSTRHMDGVYDILNFMTGDGLFTHQLPRAGEECRPYLLKQYPQLDSPEMQFALGELTEMLKTTSGKKEPEKLILGWISKITSGGYGIKIDEMLDVETVPNGQHQVRNPLEGMGEMVGKDRVIPVVVG